MRPSTTKMRAKWTEKSISDWLDSDEDDDVKKPLMNRNIKQQQQYLLKGKV